jgi:hypothetical protein
LEFWVLAFVKSLSIKLRWDFVQVKAQGGSMKKAVLLAALLLALPVAAFADSTTDYAIFGKVPGTASVSGSATASGTLSVTALLTQINGVSVPNGTVSITTGTLTATAVAGIFTFTGGTIDIMSSTHQPLFQGTFTKGSTVVVSNGVPTIIGFVGSSTVTLTINAKTISGDAIVTPEPGTLGLLGTGLVGIAGLVRRKVKAT